MPPSGHKPSEAQIFHEKISCTVTVFMSSLISSFHSQLTRLTTLSWLIAPLRRDSRQCIQPRTVSPSWDCPGNSWQFSIKAVCPETGDFKTYGFPEILDRNRPAEQAASRAWPRACTWLPADTGRTRPAANRGCNSTGAARYSKTY